MQTYEVPLGASGPVRGVCAICGVRRVTVPFHLTHGVAIQLCRAHAEVDYVWRRGGRVFTRRLTEIWEAHGVLTTRRRAALAGHIARTRSALHGEHQPGSYAWPTLRRQAEDRFAAGEDPRTVIAQLRDAHRDAPARVPSYQTMRRWFTEARWLNHVTPPRDPTRLALRSRELWPNPFLPILPTRPSKAFLMMLDGPRRPAHDDFGRPRRAGPTRDPGGHGDGTTRDDH